jgi:hypothetical protein
MPTTSSDATGLGSYLWAFVSRWSVAMSGPLTVPFTAAGLYVDSTWARALFVLLAVTCAFVASFLVWRRERQRAVDLAGQVRDLTARLAPKLVLVREACCQNNPTLGRVGVANPTATTVGDALVYLTVPALQIHDLLVKWAGREAGKTLDVHPGNHHYHTDYFLVLGDNPGLYCLVLAYVPTSPRARSSQDFMRASCA